MIQHKNDVDLHFNKNNLSPKSQNHANEITKKHCIKLMISC